MLRDWLTLVVVGVLASSASAAVVTKKMTYTHEGTTFVGFLAYDDAAKGKRPGILVVHEWWGLNDYAQQRAEALAKLGYVAFACDMYGEGKTTEHPKEAGAMATAVRKDAARWTGRAAAALKLLQSQEQTDAAKVAAIGYCFGGSTALQLALGGADLAAVVSFHGALPTITAADAKAIKAKILICHGADDSFIPEDAITKFRAALEGASVDYQFVYYGNAQHSFTVPGIDAKGVKGLKYNAAADQRSWAQMQALFAEVFGK
jgi:dienelactone hydrolase